MKMMQPITEFPYRGKFIKIDEGRYEDIETEVYNGIMDIQVTTPEMGKLAQEADYAVYMPMPKMKGQYIIPVEKDDRFIGYRFNEVIQGRVINWEPSQFGKMTVYINRQIWNANV